MSKQFYFKQISSTLIRSLNTLLYVKTVNFKQFSLVYITLFSSFWPIDMTLSGNTSPNQSRPKSNYGVGVLNLPKKSGTGFSAVYYHTLGTHYGGGCGGGLTPRQSCNWYHILPERRGWVNMVTDWILLFDPGIWPSFTLIILFNVNPLFV